jgi:tetratricopeptide (TPR) repeat protein
LVLAFIVSGCATDRAFREKQARGFRDRGEVYLAGNQTSQALEQFLQALEIYPDDPYLHYDLALAYDMKGALDKTEYHLKEAIELKTDYSDAYNYLGFVYFRTGKVDDAIKCYHKALDNMLYQNPQDAHLNLGVAYLNRKEYEKAVVQLEKAIKLVPDFTAAYNSLGQAYEGLRKYGEARLAYEKALEYNPVYTRALLNLGKLLYRSGEKQKATKYFDRVVKLEPDSDRAKEAQRYLRALGK